MSDMYQIILSSQVIKQIKSLPKYVKVKLKPILKTLEEYPIPAMKYDVKKIKGEKFTYRIRIGKYRLIYEIKEESKEIYILGVSHRKKAYK